MRRFTITAGVVLSLGLSMMPQLTAAQADAPTATGIPAGSMMLTIFLKHDESKPLDELNAQLKRQNFYTTFPPQGVEVVSWVVMMGIGQVVTLRFPAERLRDVNRAIEQTAWGPYHTEFYPTYDYKATAMQQRQPVP